MATVVGTAPSAAASTARRSLSPGRLAWRVFLRNRPAVAGMVVVLAFFGLALGGLALTRGSAPVLNPREVRLPDKLKPPLARPNSEVVPNCPATYQNALQIKDSTFAQGGQTVALSVPVDGSFSIPLAFTSPASGPFLICAYLHEGVGTDAFASHAVDVAAAPAAVARPGVLAKPKLTRSGRTP